MKSKSYIYAVYTLIAFVFLLQSCVKNDISLNNVDGTIGVNGSLVFPIATSTITISQFLNKLNATNLSQDNTGTMYLYYNPTVPYNFNLNVGLQDVPVTQSVDFNGFTGSAAATVINNQLATYENVAFDLKQLSSQNITELDSVAVNSMQLVLTLNSNINFNNNQASITITPDPTVFVGITPTSYSQVGYASNLNNQPITFTFSKFVAKPNSNGKFPMKVLLQELTPANNVTITNSSYFNYTVTLKNVNFSAMYGQFSFNVPPQTGTIDLGFMNNFIQSNSILPFTNPQVKLVMKTNARLPLDFKVNSITSYDTSQPNNTLSATFDNGSLSKNFPLNNMPARVGSWGTNTLTFDKNNGHIDNLFTLPGINTVAFTFSGFSRSDTIVRNQFVTQNDTFQILPYAVIPLTFNPGATIYMSDTVTINNQSFHDFLNKTNVNEMALWLIADNNTSAQIGLSASLLNSNQQIVGTPQNVTLKVTANVDTSGRPVLTTGTQTDQYFKLSFNYSDLQQASYLLLTYTLQGKDIQTPLTVNAADFVKVKVSAYANGISFNH